MSRKEYISPSFDIPIQDLNPVPANLLFSTHPSSYLYGYLCLHPYCGHISSRVHDLKRHMTKHFPPAVGELLDCMYWWCGRTGKYGFKREDHRKEHYRTVHMYESKYTKSGRTKSRKRLGRNIQGRPNISAPPATYLPVLPPAAYLPVLPPATYLPVLPENEKNPVHAKAMEAERTIRESGNSRTSRLSTEAVALLESQQPPKVHENLPDQEIVGLNVSVPESGVVISSASDARSVRPVEWTATLSGDVEMESSKAKRLSSYSDDERAEQYLFQSETITDGDGTLFSPMSHDSIKDKLVSIRNQVLETVIANELGQYYASLNIEWDIFAFMEDQFSDHDFPNTKLGLVVTLSGAVQHAQAKTCSEYIRQNWPAHGPRVLDGLQDALNSPTHTSRSNFVTCSDDGGASCDVAPSSHAELEFNVTQKKVCLNIKCGTPDVIVDVVQQLAWMGAALRSSAGGRVQYCEPKLAEASGATGVELVLDITFAMSSPGEEDQSCWLSLFKDPVIAHRFPTTLRNDHEVGLEIPLDMMAALGGARHAVDFDGGLVLKGFSTLFVPIRRHEDSVQWHLTCARGEDRISYSEASTQCPNRALLEDLNHEELKTMRAFLGWWKDAETHLATADADYKNIDWSKAKEAGPSPRLTGGTLGVSKIVSAQVSFVLGVKDGPYHYSQHEPFQKTIDRADRLPITLYDQKDRTAWLVPALPVILHIIQFRNHIKPFVVGGNQVQISPLDPSRQGHAAKEAVARNKSQELFDCETNEEKKHCFRDAILDTWSILDRLMEREATTQATPGVAVHSTWQNTLYGWEFRDIAEEERHLKQKTQILEKTAGRWYDLVKDVDAVVLFASGLGDIIKPRSELTGLCRKWRRLPKEKDYLAVCVPLLEIFYERAGHRHDRQYLTSAKLQWHRGSMLFEKCVDISSNCCKCDRLQQVYHDSYKTFGHRTLPGNLEANGCVVFGQANHSMKPVTRSPAKSGSLYTLSNDHIDSTALSRHTPSPENCTLTPEHTDHFEPYYNGNDWTRTPSPDRAPPSVRPSNDYLLDGPFKPNKGRRRLPHPGKVTPDEPRNLDEAIQRVSAPSGRINHTEQEDGIPIRDFDSSVMKLKRTRRPIQAHDDAPVTVPKINGYRAPMEACQHLNGCSCISRFTANLGSQYPYVHTSAKDGRDSKNGSGR